MPLKSIKDDQLISVIEGETSRVPIGFSQTVDSNGNTMGGVEHVNIDGTWTPAAWNMWSVGFVAFHVDIETEGSYRFRVIAWGSDYGDGVAANMTAYRRSCRFIRQTPRALAR